MVAGFDCVVIGHHGRDRWSNSHPQNFLERGEPAELRELLRNRIEVDGAMRTYLEAFSIVRNTNPISVPIYTLEELPSLTSIYLVSFLRRRGLGATFVNSFTHEQARLASLLEDQPLAVAITTTFYQETDPVQEIVDFIKERSPSVPIIIGGPLIFNLCQNLPTQYLWHAFDRIGADFYVVEAQGEQTLELLLRSLKSSLPGEVPNVFHRCGREWLLLDRVIENNDMDKCSIDWGSFAKGELGETVSLRTARSCAFRCSFCDYPVRAGKLSLTSLERVKKELIALADLGVRRVSFIDDTFNVPVGRFRDLCLLLIELDLGIEWYCYFRCSNVPNENTYDVMTRAGCRGVFLGIESCDDRLLANMDKGATIRQYKLGIPRLQERGIWTHASFIVGFPGETKDTVNETIRFLETTQPDSFSGGPWYYLHNTPIHKQAAKFGLRGEGKRWEHNTMSALESIDQTDRIIQEVENSAWLPVPGFDFWGIPYLRGKGFSNRDILKLLRLGSKATPLGAKGRLDSGTAMFRDFARGLNIRCPRYTRGQVPIEGGAP